MRRAFVALFAFGLTTFAQQSRLFKEHIGAIGINRASATWSSPESLARNLRSDEPALRAAAEALLGVDPSSWNRDGAQEVGSQYFS